MGKVIMVKLPSSNYWKIKPLIKSANEISVFGVIDGIVPGDIFANDAENPTAALIKSTECNLVAGATDGKFISEISAELDFWDEVTPDSPDWFEQIPALHKNKFIRPFKRRRYVLDESSFAKREKPLPDGFVLEKVDLGALRSSAYKNAGKVLEWAEGWGNDAAFAEKGVGTYIRNNDTIVSWSLGDCSYADQITIGVKTDEEYRKRGFGIRVVSEAIKESFGKGYKTINWLCVDSNRGSIIIAEKLGFRHNNDYYCFYSYLPTENPTDISEGKWLEWAEYLEESSAQEPRLMNECLYAYMKANDVAKTIEIIKHLPQFGEMPDIENINRDIRYYQSMGLCSNFYNSDWKGFVKSCNCI